MLKINIIYFNDVITKNIMFQFIMHLPSLNFQYVVERNITIKAMKIKPKVDLKVHMLIEKYLIELSQPQSKISCRK